MLSELKRAQSLFTRRGSRIDIAAAVVGLTILLLAGSAFARFDSHGWRYVRQISVPAHVPEGLVVVPLTSHIIGKCRPDFGDIRVVTSEGTVLPVSLGGTDPPRDDNLIPTRIYRVAKRPGAWTDIWIDKSAKTLSRGILIQTTSRDFVRKVEVRGSDNAKDLYVIRMDGLLIDQESPIRLCSLGIEHPLNNFQYIALRIHDNGEPPLRIESVFCYRPMPEPGLSRSLSARIIENRTDPRSNATVVIAGLRDNSLPVSHVAIATKSKDFVRKVAVHCGSSASGPWDRVFEGTFFRVTRGEVGKENLKAVFRPQVCRYLMLELSAPSGPPVPIDEIEAASTTPFMAFDHSRDRAYRFFYGNPSAEPFLPGKSPLPPAIQTVASASSGITFSEEEQNVPPLREEPRTAASGNKPGGETWRTSGAVLLLLALLILVGLMVRSRRARKRRRRPGRRLHDMG